MPYAFSPPPRASIAVAGTRRQYPVHRIFCVGRNYAAHAREMGADPTRESPFFFCKSPAHVTASGGCIPYPPATANFHHEIELVIALGHPGFEVSVSAAKQMIYGCACGLDMTRRDLQQAARDKGHPWTFGKDFEHGAIVAPIQPLADGAYPTAGRIWLAVNNDIRQDGDLSELIWSVPEIIAHLSRHYHLVAGDLIFTGTPAGVGPVMPGDTITGGIQSVGKIRIDVESE